MTVFGSAAISSPTAARKNSQGRSYHVRNSLHWKRSHSQCIGPNNRLDRSPTRPSTRPSGPSRRPFRCLRSETSRFPDCDTTNCRARADDKAYGRPPAPFHGSALVLKLLCPRQTTLQHYRCRSEEHTSELQSRFDLVCRLLLEKKKNK